MYCIAVEAAKIAAPECPKLSNEKILNILKWSTLSNFAENILKVNNLQNKILRILWFRHRDNRFMK